MAKEVVLARRAAAAATLRAGRQTLDHQRRLATIASIEAVAEAEMQAAISIIDLAAAQPENGTAVWLFNRYFKD